jgi:hypothetical protein
MFTPAAIKAGGFSFSATWLIMRNIQDLRARVAQITARHLVAHLSQKKPFSSPPVAIPPAPYNPDPVLSPSGSSLLWAIVYWLPGLVFCLTAMFIAIFVKQKIRSYRVVLQGHSQPWEKAKMQYSFDRDAMAWDIAMDMMYRLFRVSLVVLILGHINFFLYPVSPTIFVLAVVYGLAHALVAIGVTIVPLQTG